VTAGCTTRWMLSPLRPLLWLTRSTSARWTGTRKADAFAPACMQVGVSMPGAVSVEKRGICPVQIRAFSINDRQRNRHTVVALRLDLRRLNVRGLIVRTPGLKLCIGYFLGLRVVSINREGFCPRHHTQKGTRYARIRECVDSALTTIGVQVAAPMRFMSWRRWLSNMNGCAWYITG